MSEYLSDFMEDPFVICPGCQKKLMTDESTLEDWEFAWDGLVTEDCCTTCFYKYAYKGNDYE